MSPVEVDVAFKRASRETLARINEALDAASAYWLPRLVNDPTIANVPLAIIAAQRVAMEIELVAGGALGRLAPPRN